MSHPPTLRLSFVLLFLVLIISAASYAQEPLTLASDSLANQSGASPDEPVEKRFGSLSGQVTSAAPKGREQNMSGIRLVVRRLNAGFGNFTFDRLTGEQGEFSFGYLMPGQYQIEVDRRTLPATIPNSAPKVEYLTINLQKETRVELRLAAAASIAGSVYLDADKDGHFNASKDRPVAGATIIAEGQTKVSGKDGSYVINDLTAGRQLLLVRWPNGKQIRIAMDLYAGSTPQILDIGTDDETRTRLAPPTAETVALKSKSENIVVAKPPQWATDTCSTTETPIAVSQLSEYSRPTAHSGPLGPDIVDIKSSNLAPVAGMHVGVAPMSSASLKGYSTGDPEIDRFIILSSARYQIDPLLIYAQMGQESSYNQKAVSPKGASGLMQLMPATAQRMGVTNIYDPQQNIEGGVKYMRLLMDLFHGDLSLVLAGYNAGEGAVIRFGYQIPPYNETQDYVRRISARYRSITFRSEARTSMLAAAKSGQDSTDNGRGLELK